MRNIDVTEAFRNRMAARTLNLCSTGDKLFSYSTCIAQYYEGKLVGNGTWYSRTTSTHFNQIRQVVDMYTTKTVPRGATSLVEYL